MKIKITFDGDSAEIEGDVAALRELADALSNCGTPPGIARQVVALPCLDKQWEAAELLLTLTRTPIVVSQAGRMLQIEGSPEKLSMLAENISWLADQDNVAQSSAVQDHIHLDYYPGHFFLDKRSLPLVLTRHK